MAPRDALPTSKTTKVAPDPEANDLLKSKDPADPRPGGPGQDEPSQNAGLDLNPSSQPEFGSPAEAVVPESEKQKAPR